MEEAASQATPSIHGRLFAEDWISQLFALALFFDTCLAVIWNTRLVDVRSLEPLRAIGFGPALIIFLAYVLFSRAAAPAIRYVLECVSWKFPLVNLGGIAGRDVRDLAVDQQNEQLMTLWLRHAQHIETEKAKIAARWVLALCIFANCACAFVAPTAALWLFELWTNTSDNMTSALVGSVWLLAVGTALFATWEALAPIAIDQMHGLPASIVRTIKPPAKTPPIPGLMPQPNLR